MSTHRRLNQNFPKAVVHRCERPQCKLDLSGIPGSQITVLDLDNYRAKYEAAAIGQMTKIADFLVFLAAEAWTVAVVEMKTKAHEAAAAAEQLREGAKVSELLLAGDPHARCLPVLLHRGIRRVAQQKLLKEKVKFRGKDYGIFVKPCGTKLKEILALAPR